MWNEVCARSDAILYYCVVRLLSRWCRWARAPSREFTRATTARRRGSSSRARARVGRICAYRRASWPQAEIVEGDLRGPSSPPPKKKCTNREISPPSLIVYVWYRISEINYMHLHGLRWFSRAWRSVLFKYTVKLFKISAFSKTMVRHSKTMVFHLCTPLWNNNINIL